jgi:Icc-related predicted phosphoesterase
MTVKFLCGADIHGDTMMLSYLGNICKHTKNIDAILLAGDICVNEGYKAFIYMLNGLHEHAEIPIILTPGNHDYWDPNNINNENIHCLVNEHLIFNGVKIFGTPYTPRFANWNWMANDEEINYMIDHDTDIVLTHGPPYGYWDCVKSTMTNAGSEALLESIKKTKCQHVICGHIHEHGGRNSTIKDHTAKVHNVSMMSLEYQPCPTNAKIITI